MVPAGFVQGLEPAPQRARPADILPAKGIPVRSFELSEFTLQKVKPHPVRQVFLTEAGMIHDRPVMVVQILAVSHQGLEVLAQLVPPHDQALKGPGQAKDRTFMFQVEILVTGLVFSQGDILVTGGDLWFFHDVLWI